MNKGPPTKEHPQYEGKAFLLLGRATLKYGERQSSFLGFQDSMSDIDTVEHSTR